jgi:hypothetical protein
MAQPPVTLIDRHGQDDTFERFGWRIAEFC